MRVLSVLLCIAVAGCVVPTVTQKAAPGVNFKAFRTVSYSVQAASDIEIEQDRKFSDLEIALLGAELDRRLHVMGYEIAGSCATADFCLNVAVTESKEGAPAARFLIGFGAGRAVLKFDAAFTNSRGQTIAAFKGGRSLTGMAPGEIFAGTDDIQGAAVSRATQQISEFILNDGDIPDPRTAKR